MRVCSSAAILALACPFAVHSVSKNSGSVLPLANAVEMPEFAPHVESVPVYEAESVASPPTLYLGRGVESHKHMVIGYRTNKDLKHLVAHPSDTMEEWDLLGMKRGFVIGNKKTFRASTNLFGRKYCFESVMTTKQVPAFLFPLAAMDVENGYSCRGTIEPKSSELVRITIEPDVSIFCNKLSADDNAFIVCKRGNSEVSRVGLPVDEKYPVFIENFGTNYNYRSTIQYVTTVAFGIFTN